MTQDETNELRRLADAAVLAATSASATSGDVKAIRQWIEDRRPTCERHGDDIETLKAAGRPVSKTAILLVTLMGQLIVGAGVVLAVVKMGAK